MKQAFLISFLLIILTGCSKEQKAKELIKDYLNKNLDDAKSYDPIEYGKLEEMYVDPLYRIFYLTELRIDIAVGTSGDEAYKKMAAKEKKSLQGYYMSHTFRAKNSYGGYIKKEYEFYFDKDITEIKDTYTPPAN